MDSAVSLVETYLRLNGYFTVTEFPVVELPEGADYRTATDLDILALRFPTARRLVPGSDGEERGTVVLDPALGIRGDEVDMIVGEVKESTAEFNPAGLRAEVLGAVLARFGCCPVADTGPVVRRLLERGRAKSHVGHAIRLVAFGGRVGDSTSYLQIPLGHVLVFLKGYVREHWAVLKHVQAKDPTLGLLMLAEKLEAASG